MVIYQLEAIMLTYKIVNVNKDEVDFKISTDNLN
jgi:hypothetical protein